MNMNCMYIEDYFDVELFFLVFNIVESTKGLFLFYFFDSTILINFRLLNLSYPFLPHF